MRGGASLDGVDMVTGVLCSHEDVGVIVGGRSGELCTNGGRTLDLVGVAIANAGAPSDPCGVSILDDAAEELGDGGGCLRGIIAGGGMEDESSSLVDGPGANVCADSARTWLGPADERESGTADVCRASLPRRARGFAMGLKIGPPFSAR